MSRMKLWRSLIIVSLTVLVALSLHLPNSSFIPRVALAEEVQVQDPQAEVPESGEVTERGVDVRDHRGMVPAAPTTTPPPLAPAPLIAVGPPVDTNPCVSNVRSAFLQIRTHGDKLGFYHSQSPGAYSDLGHSHYQGIQRLRNGNFLAISGSTSSAAEVLIVDLHSRSGTGRLRSNRLSSNAPPSGDQVVHVIPVSSALTHAGGFQVMGDFLVVGVEKDGRSEVVLFNMQRPLAPVELFRIPRLAPLGGFSDAPSAGATALVKRPDGRFLLLVGRADSNILDFYISSSTNLTSTTFVPLDSWHERELRSENGMDREFGNYQNLNLIRQCDGLLFLVGLHNNTAGLNVARIGEDWADLFRLDLVADGSQAIITKVANRHLYCKDMCNLDAGGGTYVSPNGDLFIYGIEHWRHNNMARFNEFRPVPIQANPPLTDITKSWVELYDDDGFEDRSIMIDYLDHGLRNYSDYDNVEGFEDKTSAARWLLPAGWQYLLFQHKNFKGRMLRLEGNGNVQAIADFNKIGWNDQVSSSRFAKREITRSEDSWVELFDDSGFTDRRLVLHGRVPPIEDFKTIVVEGERGFGDKVSSARFQIPRGFVYRLYQNDHFGGRFIDLVGTGLIQEIPDLASLDFNDRTSSSKYLP